ncbi:MAG TPA: pyridoxamine 5'-phosphate oxidase family protein [Ktedonobacterales bacterium]
MPALQLPEEVAAVLHAYYTCEVTTVNGKGQPMTWPALAYYDEAIGEIFFSVSIAFPVKAQNARKRPQVSLLYSDPTGSGLDQPPAVLVQGDATVAEILEMTPHVSALNKLARQRQPDSGRFQASNLSRRLFSWYLFKRIGITVRPRRLTVWPNRDFSQTPTVIEVAESEAVDVE